MCQHNNFDTNITLILQNHEAIIMKTEYEFDTIYKDYFPKIHKFLVRMVGQFQAEDLAQEVFNKIHKGLSGYKGKSSLSTWIYRIATNVAIDKTRTHAFKNDKRKEPSGKNTKVKDDDIMADKNEKSSDHKIIKEEMSGCVREFIERLSNDYKTVLILSEYEHKSNKEIANILNISIGTVKIRLHRAKAKLKIELDSGCDFYHDDQNVLSCDKKQPNTIFPKIPK